MLCMFVPVALFAQSTVSGTVYDADNEPVIGATVIEKGNPSNGTISDIDGKFSLTLKKVKQLRLAMSV